MFNETDKMKKFNKRVFLSTPTMHKEELKYITQAYRTNWMSTVGENINEVEKIAAKTTNVKYAVALCNCTSALHLCVKLAGEFLYGKPHVSHGVLEGKKFFSSDITFSATLNPAIYEGGTPIFIETDYSSWDMDPKALEKAFELYPEVKLVVYAELYGFPGRVDEIRKVCKKHNAILIEDAAEAMGASVGGEPCGSFGDYSAISYNGNKIITGSSGGCLLTNDKAVADKARKLSTQARECAPWYQHEEIGYNYRMSNVIAGVVRGQYGYLNEHIAQKKAIYERYKQAFKDLPVKMNPISEGNEPNYWLSAIIIDEDRMCKQDRGDKKATYVKEKGKTCPTEILETLELYNAEGRPIWKPMHLQPVHSSFELVGKNGLIKKEDYGTACDVGANIFARGVCLPSDNKMTESVQNQIIEIVKRCFD